MGVARILDLQDFLIRARVFKLYRQALRISRRAPLNSKDELRQVVRQELENNRTCNDKQRIRFLINDGLERLKRLDETLDMQGVYTSRRFRNNTSVTHTLISCVMELIAFSEGICRYKRITNRLAWFCSRVLRQQCNSITNIKIAP